MKLSAPKTQSPQRLDTFITGAIAELNRSYAGKLCDENKVRVNGQPQSASYKVKPSDKIELDFDLKDLRSIPSINLPVLYEDKDVIVVNKPVGVLTHSKGAYNPEATVATFIKPKLNGLEGERAGIVHRLDRATSGVIVCAKNAHALTWLQKQFSARKVKKQYIAIIEGHIEPAEAIIDKPIARNPKAPKTFHVSTDGKPAETHYKSIHTGEGYSLLELYPKTGRTHQLRVHLKSVGKPIVGDELYGGKPNERLLLHAHKLTITLPSKTSKEFVAEIPKNFHTVINDKASSTTK